MPPRTSKNGTKRFTPLEAACIDHFMVCNSQVEALRKARGGKVGKQDTHTASTIFKRPHVRAEVKRRQKALAEKFEVTAERILQEADTCGLIDPALLVDDDGSPLPLHQVPEMARRALAGFEIVETVGKDGEITRRYKYQWAKVPALNLSARVRGMLNESVTLNLGDDALALIFAAMPQEMADAVKRVIAERLKKQKG